jgi:hypothetical protein
MSPLPWWMRGEQSFPLQQIAPAAPGPSGNPVNGYRVDFEMRPAGTLITGDWKTLLRATDKNVHVWQVTLSPVFRNPIGANTVGMPVIAGDTGSPRFRMTFGAGGVTFRHEGSYPVCGASFSVTANEVAIEVMANDGVTVFTPQNVPSVLGWITPDASPQTASPLFAGVGESPLVGPFTASPWTRAIWVYESDGTPVAVTFTGPIGTLTTVVPSGTRIPLPANALRYSASGAAMTSLIEEISFT